MNKQEISVFQAMDRMVKDDNHGIMMSKTITKVSTDLPQGSIISFGVENNIGKDALVQTFGGPGEYMVFMLAVKRTELDKTRAIIMQEQFESQQTK